MKSNQNGRSMIEMLGVLAIVGVLSVGGIMAFQSAMNKHKTNTILSGLTHTVNNVKTLFLQQNNLSGFDTKEAYDAGVIPDEFKANYDPTDLSKLESVVHSYGGQVKVVAKSVASETGAANATSDDTGENVVYYAIQITGLPRDVAMQISTQEWGDSGDLVSVNVNNGQGESGTQEQQGGGSGE